jgi:zinc transport system substrate-binding protein
VAVSIIPQAYFVERIGGRRVTVEVLVGPGQSPHAFEPTPRQVTALGQADVYFTIGIDFERSLLPRVEKMFKNVQIVDTQAGIKLRSYTRAEAEAGEHGESGHGPADSGPSHDTGGEHQHHDRDHDHAAGAPDPHTWLNPRLVKIQARTICDTLARLDPGRADEYRGNLAAFQAELDQVRDEIAAVLDPLKGREVFVFHPAFGYFLEEFGLKQVPVEIAGKEPTARQLAQLIDRAKAAGVKVIFVQPQFPTKSAEAVARAIDGVVVPLDDLSPDYFANLRDIAAKIKAKFGAARP